MVKKKISYNKLWKILKDRHLPKCWLCDESHEFRITCRTLAKIVKDKSVTTDTLLKICGALDTKIEDICETIDYI